MTALYEDWTAPVMPSWVDRAPKGIKLIVASRFSHHKQKVLTCQSDGLPQIAPIVAAMEKSPAELRKELGKAVWRKIHHSTETTNARRAYLWLFSMGRLTMAQIIEFRPCHLPKLVSGLKVSSLNLGPAHIYAGKFAPPGLFDEIAILYRDTQRMGIAVNPEWSLTRLKREHDAAALADAMKKTDQTPWAVPYRAEVDGLLFVRLTSDRDLSVEGLIQRHCVASYSVYAKRGVFFIFSISGDERATYAFDERGDDVDLQGFANTAPSARVRRAAEKFKKRFWADLLRGMLKQVENEED
ncbi:PcfJ domain-containing protein [Salipiger marinus]|uniref:PcfJ domain-containing protein n=1 Tax=Salipiger marinus TaxID=555512 RepID=UPI004058339D